MLHLIDPTTDFGVTKEGSYQRSAEYSNNFSLVKKIIKATSASQRTEIS